MSEEEYVELFMIALKENGFSQVESAEVQSDYPLQKKRVIFYGGGMFYAFSMDLIKEVVELGLENGEIKNDR